MYRCNAYFVGIAIYSGSVPEAFVSANYQVSISCPVSVTRICTSHWAEGLPSSV